jgi:hypothetical protein
MAMLLIISYMAMVSTILDNIKNTFLILLAAVPGKCQGAHRIIMQP